MCVAGVFIHDRLYVVDTDPDCQSIAKEELIPGQARNTTCHSVDKDPDVHDGCKRFNAYSFILFSFVLSIKIG